MGTSSRRYEMNVLTEKTLHVELRCILLSGMVHSVEPGIYGLKMGGIRIEDDILGTTKGVEYLSDYLRIQE